MTKTAKIVLGAAAALILALLGGYLWIEYGGSPESPDIPDAFSIQLQEGIQEIIDYAATMKAQAPKLAPVANATLTSVEGLAELDAQLRRQGMELEERRMRLKEKYFKNSLEGVHQEATHYIQEGTVSMMPSEEAFDSERVMELSRILSASPTKLSTLLGGMSDQEFEATTRSYKRRFGY